MLIFSPIDHEVQDEQISWVAKLPMQDIDKFCNF